VLAHLVDQLVGDNAVAQSPDEEDRTLDIKAALDAQERLVGLVVGWAVAVVVACGWDVSPGYSYYWRPKHWCSMDVLHGAPSPFLAYCST
jgi:hypothetical protein